MAEQPRGTKSTANSLSLLLGAALAGIVFSTTHYSSCGHVLSWLSLAALSMLASRCSSVVMSMLVGGVFGVVYHGAQLDFIRTTGIPGDWFACGPFWDHWFGTVIGGGVVWSASTLAIHWMHLRAWPMAIGLPAVIVTQELIAEHGCWWLVGSSCVLCQLSLKQVDCAVLIQVAAWGGTGIVSWIAATIAGLAADTTRVIGSGQSQPKCLKISLGVFLGLIVGGVGFGCGRLSEEPIESVSCLIVPREFSPDDLSELLNIIQTVGSRPVLCLWPEVACRATAGTDGELERQIGEIARRLGCTVIVGAKRIDPEKIGPFNSALLFDSDGRLVSTYDKQFLTPGLECPSMGLIDSSSARVGGWPTFFRGVRPTMPLSVALKSASAIQPNHETDQVPTESVSVGLGICHDICVPEWATTWRAAKRLPDILVQIADESPDWTGRVQPLLLACARLRAVTLGRPLVRCVHGGFSCAIDANGRVVNARWPLSDSGDIGLTNVGLLETSGTGGHWATAIGGFLPALAVVSQIVIVVVLRRVNHMATTRETIHE